MYIYIYIQRIKYIQVYYVISLSSHATFTDQQKKIRDFVGESQVKVLTRILPQLSWWQAVDLLAHIRRWGKIWGGQAYWGGWNSIVKHVTHKQIHEAWWYYYIYIYMEFVYRYIRYICLVSSCVFLYSYVLGKGWFLTSLWDWGGSCFHRNVHHFVFSSQGSWLCPTCEASRGR